MAVHYYEKENIHYPPIVYSCLKRLLLHMGELLYPDKYVETSTEILNCFVLSDIGAGSEVSLGDAVAKFKRVSRNLPFTAYNLKLPEFRPEHNSRKLAAQEPYVDAIGATVKAWPMEMEIDLVTFYAKHWDYQRANTILTQRAAWLDRLLVPIVFRKSDGTDLEAAFKVDAEIAPSQGNYAHAFEQYLIQNKIYDIVHTVALKYWDLILDQTNIFPVDDMLVSLGNYDEYGQPFQVRQYDLPNPLTIISTVPANEATGINPNSNITIEFSEGVVENSFEFEIIPFIEGRFDWTADCKSVTYIPNENLATNTLYLIQIAKTVKSGYEQNLEEDFSFTFTTST